jgi:hypothetical protein
VEDRGDPDLWSLGCSTLEAGAPVPADTASQGGPRFVLPVRPLGARNVEFGDRSAALRNIACCKFDGAGSTAGRPAGLCVFLGARPLEAENRLASVFLTMQSQQTPFVPASPSMIRVG